MKERKTKISQHCCGICPRSLHATNCVHHRCKSHNQQSKKMKMKMRMLLLLLTVVGTEASGTYWGEFTDGSCISPGYALVESRLWGVPNTADWIPACKRQPAIVNQIYFPQPTDCEYRGWLKGVVGKFLVPSDKCFGTWGEVLIQGCQLLSILWGIPPGQSWKDWCFSSHIFFGDKLKLKPYSCVVAGFHVWGVWKMDGECCTDAPKTKTELRRRLLTPALDSTCVAASSGSNDPPPGNNNVALISSHAMDIFTLEGIWRISPMTVRLRRTAYSTGQIYEIIMEIVMGPNERAQIDFRDPSLRMLGTGRFQHSLAAVVVRPMGPSVFLAGMSNLGFLTYPGQTLTGVGYTLISVRRRQQPFVVVFESLTLTRAGAIWSISYNEETGELALATVQYPAMGLVGLVMNADTTTAALERNGGRAFSGVQWENSLTFHLHPRSPIFPAPDGATQLNAIGLVTPPAQGVPSRNPRTSVQFFLQYVNATNHVLRMMMLDLT